MYDFIKENLIYVFKENNFFLIIFFYKLLAIKYSINIIRKNSLKHIITLNTTNSLNIHTNYLIKSKFYINQNIELNQYFGFYRILNQLKHVNLKILIFI